MILTKEFTKINPKISEKIIINENEQQNQKKKYRNYL